MWIKNVDKLYIKKTKKIYEKVLTLLIKPGIVILVFEMSAETTKNIKKSC